MQTLSKILLLLPVLFLFSCEDIFEEDIEDDTLVVTSPLENAIIESNVTNFKWEEMEGATKYRIQVYDSNDNEIADTLVKDKYNLLYPLNQGQYKWKARAENSAYQSKYSPLLSFSVVESLDLTNQVVLLTSPADTYYTNELSFTCKWRDLSAAETYDFELFNVTNGQTLIEQSDVTANSYPLSSANIATEAKYLWRVKGKNSSSETLFSSRTFFIDRNIPNNPSMTSPVNNSTQPINQDITFSWTTPADNGPIQSPLSYVIEVSNNISFASLVYTTTVTTNTIQKSFTANGEYYWRVKTVDAAKNSSNYSIPFKFTIN